MNRTPRSARRRASRQFEANEPFLGEQSVEAVDLLDDQPLGALADAVRAADVVHGIPAGLELHALKPPG
jgi:hypothetical protein